MRLKELYHHALLNVPKHTDLFHDVIDGYLELVQGSNIMTIYSTSHGLNIGSTVSINGGLITHDIVSIEQSFGLFKIGFSSGIDLVKGEKLTLFGFDDPAYNIEYDIWLGYKESVDVLRGNLTLPTLTGGEYMQSYFEKSFMWNRVFIISEIIDADTFTVKLPAQSTITTTINNEELEIGVRHRIQPVVTTSDIPRLYTDQPSMGEKWWLFLAHSGQLQMSKDRSVSSDAYAVSGGGTGENRSGQYSFDVVAVVPSDGSIGITPNMVTRKDALDWCNNDGLSVILRSFNRAGFTEATTDKRTIIYSAFTGSELAEFGVNESDISPYLAMRYNFEMEQRVTTHMSITPLEFVDIGGNGDVTFPEDVFKEPDSIGNVDSSTIEDSSGAFFVNIGAETEKHSDNLIQIKEIPENEDI